MTRPSPTYMPTAENPGRLTALLGPTNTGKTHLAVERMLGHETGMIGLPLRLLAREIYDRIKILRGPHHVALITGEEKIIPSTARYFVCTVEAMPMEREVEFLAIDEIQLSADRERGHIFTDRLLYARGREETMLLGSQTVRNHIARLLPNAEIVTRPRFSELSWAGTRKMTRIPRRSAIVAFSTDQVYAIAELIRRQRGGAAVVMGALSPRTRNAQVALYQNGDVDFLVATDAIGMGLNMDIDHVAFAATAKFDGQNHRPLKVSELAQIAGRAGRYMNNGTFGTTGEAGALTPETIERIENHQFDSEPVLLWRNPALDFSSIAALIHSLEVPPQRPGLARAPAATDFEALTLMMQDQNIAAIAQTPAAIRQLWNVAQVPDFRKTMAGEHAGLLAQLYLFLMGPDGTIPADWIANHVRRLDRTEGDIDTLANRIMHIRTWTFISNRADWLHDPAHWQERTRRIEDRLSDALHERLTQRFIDRRTSVLMKRLRQNEDLMAAINSDGEVLVEGEYVGKLQGFTFVPDPRAEGVHGKALRAASDSALAQEIAARADRLAVAADADISLSDHARLIWLGAPVAQLSRSGDTLAPRLELIAGDQLAGPARDKIRNHLEQWLKTHIATILKPLVDLKQAQDIDGLARGIAFRLVENRGALRREQVAEDIRALDQTARGQLRKHGVRFGAYSIFMPALLKPAPAHLLLMLWALSREEPTDQNQDPFADLPPPPTPGLTSVPAEKTAPQGFYETLGFRVCGTRAVRLDMLERLADLIRPVIAARTYRGGFVTTPAMLSLVGCSGEDFTAILKGLGYRPAMEKPPAPKTEPPVEATPEAEAKPGTETTPRPDASPADTAPAEIEVWRPQRQKRKPARPPRKAPHEAKPGESPDQTAEAHAPHRKHQNRKDRPAKAPPHMPRRPKEPQIDPNSPFAALAVLKIRPQGK